MATTTNMLFSIKYNLFVCFYIVTAVVFIIESVAKVNYESSEQDEQCIMRISHSGAFVDLSIFFLHLAGISSIFNFFCSCV